jgi:16S rRNA (guanine527-N7)-methyltransferase
LSRDPRLVRWLESVLATPSLTAVSGFDAAWDVLVEEALAALPFVLAGPVVDVGSGGGSPGVPLAAHRPGLHFDLLESSRRKCRFLELAVRDFPNVSVVCARAEDYGRGTGRDAYAVALARALAPQPVAAEWCLPLVRPGGLLVIYATEQVAGLERAAAALAASPPEVVGIPGVARRSLVLLRKLAPTPERFPRRPGVARKRPLG